MAPKVPRGLLPLLAGVFAAALATSALAQEDSLLDWSQTAARGVFELCRGDAPDAFSLHTSGRLR